RAVLNELDFAVGKRARALRRREQRILVDKRPRAERRRRRCRAECKRLGRHLRQLVRNQRGAAMLRAGIERPVALDRAQLFGRITAGWDLAGYWVARKNI